MKKLDSTLANLQKLRSKLLDIRREIADIENQALTNDEVSANISATVDKWASLFEAGHVGINIANLEFWGTDLLAVATFGDTPVEKTISLLAWLNPDMLKQKLNEAAKPFVSVGGLTREQRQDRIKAMESEKHDIEVAEETMIVALEDEGVEVFRRPDADPAIILAASA